MAARPATALLDLLLDRRCLACGEGSEPVCPQCAQGLRGPPVRASPPALGVPPVWVAASYEGAVRALLLAAKEQSQPPPRPHLAVGLARAVAATPRASGGPFVLVPVPSTARARRQRGDDLVRWLAVGAARRLRRAGLVVEVLPLVRPRGRRADQVGLGAEARRRNVAGAFEVASGRLAEVRGRPVVVVDDIVTSGATLAEVAGALTRAGVEVIGAAAVAATPSRGWPTGIAVTAPRSPGWG